MACMRSLFLVAVSLATGACASTLNATEAAVPTGSTTEVVSTVVLVSEVQWEQLNPARGDKSPRAANLWGDRNSAGPTGFLVKFVDGFESPPHIHNVSYRGVVIDGLIHNDEPSAAHKWMPRGSFWTQPKGAVHITAAKRSDNLAYIEIDDGPYLVHPAQKAFDSGEKPMNVDGSNIVWSEPTGGAGAHRIAVAFPWGPHQAGVTKGTLVRIPAATIAKMRGDGPRIRAVVIQGLPSLRDHEAGTATTMAPGSLLTSTGRGAEHLFSCGEEVDCILYLRTEGSVELLPHCP